MRGWSLLAGLAAVLAALVLAGGDAVLAERGARAHAKVARVTPSAVFCETQPAKGFFAGAGLTSPL